MKDRKKERLFSSLSFINDEYIKEAEPKMKKSTSLKKILGSVACLALVIALSLYMFIPYGDTSPDLTAYEGSEYFPLIEKISAFRYKPSPYKNNFQYTSAILSNVAGGLLGGFMAKDDLDGSAPGDWGDNMAAAPESSGGSYVETTDNQVDGVIEADLIKRTQTHLFRVGVGTLKIYTIDKENTTRVVDFTLPSFEDEYNSRGYNTEMYLSGDGRTVTIIKKYNDRSYKSRIGIMSIDVSDFNDVKVRKQISVDGSYNSSRMVDGKLLLISEYFVNAKQIEYDKPETYVPSITDNGVRKCIEFKDIIYPERISTTRYSVVSLMDEDTLKLLGANALLSFDGAIYVSENNVYVAREYTKQEKIGEKSYYNMAMSDIAVLNYSDGSLENKGILTAEGTIKDQYSMDEQDGHLRIVTSTSDFSYAYTEQDASFIAQLVGDKNESASLTVFKLDGMEKIAEVRDFAPEGEEAASVRFDGNTAYVCTAVIVTFTDPVYFFDLSDYENITYTDTGEIDGFSSSLIQLGEGFLLGIGEENWQYGKVEVYEERNGEVVSVDKYLFNGEYSTDYKSYLIDRERNLFGFGAAYMYDEETGKSYSAYLLLAFNGYEIVEVAEVRMNFGTPDRVRAVYIDDYLYITDDTRIEVVNISSNEE